MIKHNYSFSFLLLTVIVLLSSCNKDTFDDTQQSYNNLLFGETFPIIAHRGSTCNGRFQGNSALAYISSAKLGYTFVENDIQFTKDNIPVMFHDVPLNLRSGESAIICYSNGENIPSKQEKKMYIKDYTLSELQQMFVFKDSIGGQKIQSLDEFLSLCSSLNLKPVLEFKSSITNNTQMKNIVKSVNAYSYYSNIIWMTICCSTESTIQKLKKDGIYTRSFIGSQYPLGESNNDISVLQGLINESNLVGNCGLSLWYSAYIRSLTKVPDAMELINTYKYPVLLWTCDYPECSIFELQSKGIDGIFSDNILPRQNQYDVVVHHNDIGLRDSLKLNLKKGEIFTIDVVVNGDVAVCLKDENDKWIYREHCYGENVSVSPNVLINSTGEKTFFFQSKDRNSEIVLFSYAVKDSGIFD